MLAEEPVGFCWECGEFVFNPKRHGGIQIEAEETTASELEPGDLFSFEGPFYWEHIGSKLSVGEKVYIRTNTSVPEGHEDEPVYRIHIEEVCKDDPR